MTDHKIILPPGCKLTKNIFIYYLKIYLHVVSQRLLNTVRQIFCPIKGRNICRQFVYYSGQCFQIKTTIVNQIIGNLLPERIIQNPPF